MTESAWQAAPRGDHLILYDGLCGLCNRLNRFVLPRDHREVFAFASLQSAVGRSVLQQFGRNPDDLDTFYLVTNYRSKSPELLSKASAALFVMKKLGSAWRWLVLVEVFPDALLNWFYDLIARNRYKLSGRYDHCPMPSPEWKRRFLDI